VIVEGKTGTTTNYVDAWFVGFTKTMTVAVWVGYPKGNRSMAHAYGGKPVYGGTYPAIIFRTYVEAALKTIADEQAGRKVSTPKVSPAKVGSTGSTASRSTSPTGPSAATGSTASSSPSGTTTPPLATTTPSTGTPVGSTTPGTSTPVTTGGGSVAPPATGTSSSGQGATGASG
jgi:penicillin-binding protein 1A